jgi:hypothetical protein
LLFSLEMRWVSNGTGVGDVRKGREDCRSSEPEVCCRHLFTLRSRAVFRCFSLRFRWLRFQLNNSQICAVARPEALQVVLSCTSRY